MVPSAPTAAEPGDGRPRVSVVVVRSEDACGLRAWLSPLAAAASAGQLEVVVVAPAGKLFDQAVQDLPAVRLVQLESEPTEGDLRRAGAAAAAGDIVIFTQGRDSDFHARLAGRLRTLLPGLAGAFRDDNVGDGPDRGAGLALA